ncbi:MAG: cupin domain-containing protein [Pseudomonadota bacterium]
MELNPKDFQSDLPEQHIHVYFSDEELGLEVGVWTTTSMQESFGPYPGDEFMVVLEGQVKMVDSEENEVLVKSGETFVIRNAIPISWKQEGFLRKFYMTYADPKAESGVLPSAEGGVIVFDQEQLKMQMTLMDSTEPFVIHGEKPLQNNCVNFTNDAGNMFTGMWDSTAFESEMRAYQWHEMVHLLEGRVRITDSLGITQEFEAGESFFIPKGTRCQWTVDQYVKKFYAVI